MRHVLVLIEWYLPGQNAGGPVRSIAAIAERFGERGRFLIVTRNRDLADPRPYTDLPPNRWLPSGTGSIRYLDRWAETPWAMTALLRRTGWDTLYVNTLYSGPFALVPLVLRRLGVVPRRTVVVAPRGQLDPAALAIRRAKKVAYLRAVRRLGVFRGVKWQATSPEEAADIRRWFGSEADVTTVPNLRPAAATAVRRSPPTDRLKVVFLSRVSEKKNLAGALEILANVRAPVEFSIYGHREDAGYWRRCEELLSRLPANVRATYRGVAAFADVPHVLSDHEILLLPTFGENFGHVVAEALAAGCAPLISDRTPWRGLQEAGAGWDLPLEDRAAFAHVIDAVAVEAADEREARARRAQRLAPGADVDATVAEELAALLGLPAGPA